MKQLLVCVFLSIFAFADLALAQVPVVTKDKNISFQWDASPSPDVTGYSLLRSPTPVDPAIGRFADPIRLATGMVLGATVTGLPDGTWYFAATCRDAPNNESPYSNVLAFTVDTIAPLPPGTMTNTPPVATNITQTTVQIAWKTGEPATGTLTLMNASGAIERVVVANNAMTTDHMIRLANLTAKTLYRYRATSNGADGEPAYDGDGSFLTK